MIVQIEQLKIEGVQSRRCILCDLENKGERGFIFFGPSRPIPNTVFTKKCWDFSLRFPAIFGEVSICELGVKGRRESVCAGRIKKAHRDRAGHYNTKMPGFDQTIDQTGRNNAAEFVGGKRGISKKVQLQCHYVARINVRPIACQCQRIDRRRTFRYLSRAARN